MDEILTQIILLAMKVNAETEKAVSYEFMGHVNYFNLRICKSKEEYNEEEYYQYCYLDWGNTMDKLAEMKTTLSELLKEDK